jgi:hypothetical protein
MTFSNTTGFDLPLETRPETSGFDKKVLMREASIDADDREDPTASGPDANGSPIQDEHEQHHAAVAEISSDLTAPLDPPGAADSQKVPLPPAAKQVVHRSREEVCDTLAKSAQSNNLPVPFFIRLLYQESGFNPGEVSSAGAEGIAQFMPETSASEGLRNPFDPLEAIPASARFLRKLLAQFGNLGLAAAAYNAGPRRVQDWLASKGKGKLPRETEGYVKIVTGRPAATWRVASAGGTALSVPHDAPCKEMVPAVPPEPPSVMNAAKTRAPRARDKSVTRAAAAKTPAQQHKAPIQQLAARKHKAGRKHVKLAQK